MRSDKSNSFWLAVQYLSAIVISLITLKINIDYFGTELFGMWILFTSLWGIGSNLNLGFGTAIIKYTAEANRDKDVERIKDILANGSILFLITGIIIATIGFLMGKLVYFSNPNTVPLKFYNEGLLVFIMLGINFYLRYLWIFLKSVFEGFGDFVRTSQLSLLVNILILLSVIVVMYMEYSILTLSYFYTITTVFTIIIAYIIFRKEHENLVFEFKRINFKLSKGLLKFSFSIQLTSIIGALIDPLIKFILSNHSSLNIVSLYEIARRFALAISGLFSNTFRTILPKASILKSPSEYRNFIYSEVTKISKMGIAYSGLVFGVCSILIAVVINVWFKMESATSIFLILALAESVNNYGYSLYKFLLGIGKANFLAVLQLINLITVYICLTGGLTYLNSIFGLYGYSLSVVIGNVLMLFFIKRYIHISLKDFLIGIRIYKLIILNLVLFLSVVSINIGFFDNIYTSLALLSVICSFLFWKDFKDYSSTFFNLLKGTVFQTK